MTDAHASVMNTSEEQMRRRVDGRLRGLLRTVTAVPPGALATLQLSTQLSGVEQFVVGLTQTQTGVSREP